MKKDRIFAKFCDARLFSKDIRPDCYNITVVEDSRTYTAVTTDFEKILVPQG